MKFGVQARVACRDLNLVAWRLPLPDATLVRRRQQKPVAKQLAARHLGSELAYRPKPAFAAPNSSITSHQPNQSYTGFRQSRYLARARRASSPPLINTPPHQLARN
jgi:hypothetical protein